MGALHIKLDNLHRSYFAGQVVEGRVIIENSLEDEVTEITISLEGSARVHWNDEETYKVYVVPRVTTYRIRLISNLAEEPYILYKTSLVGDGTHSTMIPEGTSTFPFRFTLPTNLPSSFTSKIGQVAYILTGEMKRPLPRPIVKAQLPFTVNGIVDLNLESFASVPQQFQRGKPPNWCAFRIGHLSLVLKLSRSGFVPGEWIDFRAEVTNMSNVNVTKLEAQLQQVTTVRAGESSKTVKAFVSGIDGLASGGIWESNLRVPALPPTGLGGVCKIIDIKYFFHFTMNISGLGDPLMVALPVMIGTIPLRHTFGEFGNSRDHVTPIMSSPQLESLPYPRQSETEFSSSDPGMEAGLPSPSSSAIGNVSERCIDPPSYVDAALTEATAMLWGYPDLPPPSYAEAVNAEGFESGDNSGSRNQNYNEDGETATLNSQASDKFVPNYITYQRKRGS